ncbi:Hypothetical predicted protein [Mytilus galloprovincialis]|uniref:C2H2-type domain-containing protein n=1 Tax=Mytilus galloprovincialis TaxID=29158 RepID=A0A8B6BT44_MYTGA|nr:Hypothetical predicted protein [Mytilus galloprovincialis]
METGEVNIALSMTATQSSQFENPSTYGAMFATDGLVPEIQYGYQCTHTGGELTPWLSIDLQNTFKIKKVVLVNRQDGNAAFVREQMDDKTCPVCKLQFSRKDVMMRHHRNKHGITEPYPQTSHADPPPPREGRDQQLPRNEDMHRRRRVMKIRRRLGRRKQNTLFLNIHSR